MLQCGNHAVDVEDAEGGKEAGEELGLLLLGDAFEEVREQGADRALSVDAGGEGGDEHGNGRALGS